MKRVATLTPEHRGQAASRRRVSAISTTPAILALLTAAPSLLAQGFLENPADMGRESGLGLVSGWHCDADLLEVQFDSYPPDPAPYGSTREDTVGPCGDADNGFALLWNWNILGDGQHTVRVFADGVEFDSATFQVNTLGAEFITGIDLQTELISLETGKEVQITWQDSKQNFVITQVEESDISMSVIAAILGGSWYGHWNAPGGSGTVNAMLGVDGMGQIVVSDIEFTGTGCAARGAGVGAGININDPLFEVLMDDGSLVEFEVLVTESFSALGGTFWFTSGPCADTDGVYYLFRN
jgi:hypothetical protein